MKSMRILLLFAVLFALLLPLNAWAADNQTDNKGQSVDIVIIMDHSNSMDMDGGNDLDDNRIVAAEMITAMVDMNGSRIAFVPFYNELFSDTAAFTDMSNFKTADSLRKEIALYSKKLSKEMNGSSGHTNTKGGTDYGKPLAYAYNLLIEAREQGSTNSPMIILLTDGSSSNPTKDDGLYFWNTSTELYTLAKDNNALEGLVDYNGNTVNSFNRFTYNEKAVNALARDVAYHCYEAGIPIYTLPLHGADDIEHLELLKELSYMTGGTSTPLSSENADQLPVFFGDMFADKIGSAQRMLNVNKTNTPNVYSVDIPLLNESIQEANIYIPLKYVNPNSIKLYDRDVNPRTPDNQEIIRIDVPGAFVVYKLRVNSPLGIWKLEFLSNDTAVQPSDISFSLLYNYNIMLQSEVKDAHMGISKSGTLELISYFIDNETQNKSTDKNLYVPCQSNLSEEDKIKFTYQLFDVYGNPIQGATGQFDYYDEQNRQMTASLDLFPFNLTAGDYSLQITAEGAGLYRTNRIPVTLKNNPPEKNQAIQETIYVEYADGTNTTLPLEIDLNQYVTDTDKDTLSFSAPTFSSGEYGADTAVMGDKLIINAIYDSTIGTQEGEILVSDGNGGTCSLDFIITINSGLLEAKDSDYLAETDGQSNIIANKNTEITFKAYRVAKGTQSKQSIDNISCEVVITDNYGTEIARFPLTDNGSKELDGTYTTPNTACNWTVTYEFKYGGTDVSTVNHTITVENHRPKAKTPEEVSTLLPKTLTYNASFFDFIESENPTASIDLSQIFSDTDTETLVYSLDADTLALAGKLDCQLNGTTLTLTGVNAGTHSYTIIATDGDNEIATFTATVKVVNLFVKWMTYVLILVAAVILLIVLIIAMIQRAKPRFPKNGLLTVTIGNLQFGTNSQPSFSFNNLSKPKKPLLLNAIVTLDTCDAVQIEYADLSFLKLLPVKNSEKLRFSVLKKPASFIVKLDNDDSKVITAGKSVLIRQNQEITLQAIGTSDPEHCVHISYSFGNPPVNNPLDPSGLDSSNGFDNQDFGADAFGTTASGGIGFGDGSGFDDATTFAPPQQPFTPASNSFSGGSFSGDNFGSGSFSGDSFGSGSFSGGFDNDAFGTVAPGGNSFGDNNGFGGSSGFGDGSSFGN